MGKRTSSAINENYRHACDCKQYELSKCKGSLSSCYTPSELAEVMRFYVLEAPIAKSDDESSTQRTLSSLGWRGQELGALEGELLKASGISSFIFLGSSTIEKTLVAMNLKGRICIEHPRALLQKPVTLSLREDGSIQKLSNNESRMQNLFRHLRNGIAHGQTYVFPTAKTILIEDRKGNSPTARILVKKETLLKWIDIVEKRG